MVKAGPWPDTTARALDPARAARANQLRPLPATVWLDLDQQPDDRHTGRATACTGSWSTPCSGWSPTSPSTPHRQCGAPPPQARVRPGQVRAAFSASSAVRNPPNCVTNSAAQPRQQPDPAL